jgi:hypothetical protein
MLALSGPLRMSFADPQRALSQRAQKFIALETAPSNGAPVSGPPSLLGEGCLPVFLGVGSTDS